MVRECPRCLIGRPIDEMKNQEMCRRCREEVEASDLQGQTQVVMADDVSSRRSTSEVVEDPLKKALTFEGEIRQDLDDDVLDEYGA